MEETAFPSAKVIRLSIHTTGGYIFLDLEPHVGRLEDERVIQPLLLHDLVIEAIVTFDDTKLEGTIRDRGEVATGALYLRLLDPSELCDIFGAFGLGNKVDMLDLTFSKHNRPVGVIFSYRRVDIKATWEYYSKLMDPSLRLWIPLYNI